MKIAALYSGGKDSNLALWKVQQQGHRVVCLATVLTENKDSFMYHKPEVEFTKLQAEALGVPLVTENTKGEKEKELEDLKRLLARVKEEFEVGGVCTGALYSEYQGSRIQNLCDELGLEVFNPLWHMGQAEELQELLREGFEFIISKIAAAGMSEDWLGRKVDAEVVEELLKLEKEQGFNVAGEGGEYESLVLDAPNFTKRIEIVKARKEMENEHTGFLVIEEAVLRKKQL